MFWRKKKYTKFGRHIFTFPDGKKLYQLKEDYFENLPAKKLLSIQENSNYIAHLGISKANLDVGIRKLREFAFDLKMLSNSRDKLPLLEKCDNMTVIIDQMDTNRKEYDGTNEAIMVSLFDMFFFFEDENLFEWSEENMEIKRHYLNTYPYFRNFFFSEIERLYVALQKHISELYPLCFGSNSDTGSHKGFEPYRYKRTQNELKITMCKEYRISQNEYDLLTIEQYHVYLNEYYKEIRNKKA